MATRNIVPRANGEGSIGTSAKHWGDGQFDALHLAGEDVAGTLSNMDLALAESTGYGIVSGCEPTLSGLTVTVGAGVVHLAGGTRKELSATNITLDSADSTNPRIDLVYITSAGVVAKVTGTAVASPVVPSVPSGGISVCNVTIAANASTGTVMDSRDMLPRWYNTGIVNVKDFGAKGDGVTDDTAAFSNAITNAANNTLIIPRGNYKINSTLVANKSKTVINNGDYTGVEPIYPIGQNLSKMALNITPYIQINIPSAANPTSTVQYYCQSVGYNPVNDHVLLVFAGYTIATSQNDQPGVVVEMTSDYQTVINSASGIELGHGNGCCYCAKDGKWYIATGNIEKGILCLNADLSVNTSHILTDNPWAIEFDNSREVFYVQTGNSTPVVNIYSYSWELLSSTTVTKPKDRYGVTTLKSQDATLINDDYAFLYNNSKNISITTYDMLTGRIKEQAIFDNNFGTEPEGLYVKNNQLFIVSVTSSYILVYTVLINNVANVSCNKYGPGQTLNYRLMVKAGYFSDGAKAFWYDFPDLPELENVSSITVTEANITIRQNGAYIVNGQDLTTLKVSISPILNSVPKRYYSTISKIDGTAFSNATNNDVGVVFMSIKMKLG